MRWWKAALFVGGFFAALAAGSMAASITGGGGPDYGSTPSLNVPSYLGPVTNNAIVAPGTTAGIAEVQARIPVIFTDNVSGTVQVCAANWYVSAASTEETAITGSATFNASIEYPAGIPAFQSAGAITIPTGATGCLPIPNVVIPNGARAWIRIDHQNSTANAEPAQISEMLDVTHGEVYNEFTISPTFLTDATVTQEGGVGSGLPFQTYRAVAILAQTTKPTFALLGDSRCSGNYEGGPTDQTGNRGPSARAVGAQFGTINLCVSGETAQAAVGSFTKRAALAAYATNSINEYGINDIVVGRTSAQVIANQTTLAGLLPSAMHKFITTLDPETTSTDNWLTVQNQTPFAENAARVTYNTSLRLSPPSGYQAVFDFASAVESSTNSGVWIPGYVFIGDGQGTHESQAGGIAIASTLAPIMGNVLTNPQAITGNVTLPTAPTANFAFGQQAFGSIRMAPLGSGPTPTINPRGTTGAATWTYVVVPKDINGNPAPAGSGGTTSTGNATLTSGNYNAITFPPSPGAYSFDIYRTAHGTSPSTTGKIGNVLASATQAASIFGYIAAQPYYVFFLDTGLAGDGTTAPTYNQTGSIQTATLGTASNCASGASPAVCGSAASGGAAVPTGTNPTLVVDTTAVTALSQILLTPDETLGTTLSVTCNTTITTQGPLVVTARTPGVSFTVEVDATVATHPTCFSWTIVN